ncbi:MAG: SDR family oxidoreductase [Acidimicrobiales bacterium]
MRHRSGGAGRDRRRLGPLTADRLHVATVDVADEAAVTEFAAASRAALGDAHVVINNAGIAGSMLPGAETSVKDLEKVFAVNFYGVVQGTLAFLPQLEANDAALVNVSSIFGMIGAPGSRLLRHQVRSGLHRGAHGRAGRLHIQVHLVHPGGIDTNIVKGTTAEDEAKALLTTPPADIARRSSRRSAGTGAGWSTATARPARFMANFVPVGVVARRCSGATAARNSAGRTSVVVGDHARPEP